jgi:hypothetical protein
MLRAPADDDAAAAVHPDAEGAGIGTALRGWSEARAERWEKAVGRA